MKKISLLIVAVLTGLCVSACFKKDEVKDLVRGKPYQITLSSEAGVKKNITIPVNGSEMFKVTVTISATGIPLSFLDDVAWHVTDLCGNSLGTVDISTGPRVTYTAGSAAGKNRLTAVFRDVSDSIVITISEQP